MQADLWGHWVDMLIYLVGVGLVLTRQASVTTRQGILSLIYILLSYIRLASD